jgi:hypothetical protein
VQTGNPQLGDPPGPALADLRLPHAGDPHAQRVDVAQVQLEPVDAGMHGKRPARDLQCGDDPPFVAVGHDVDVIDVPGGQEADLQPAP